MHRFFLRAFLLSLLLLTFKPCILAGAVVTVTNTNDSGPGSLRAAIAAAASGDTINFNVSGTITLGSPLGIGRNLIISGPGASSLSISGNNAVQVFAIGSPGVNLHIFGTTIEKETEIYGGGILSYGSLAPTNSKVSGNTVSDLWGGGIYNFHGGALTLSNTNVAGNSAPMGGGLYNYFNATLALKNTIVAGSMSGGHCRIDGRAARSSGMTSTNGGNEHKNSDGWLGKKRASIGEKKIVNL